jgi:hypothetical protein
MSNTVLPFPYFSFAGKSNSLIQSDNTRIRPHTKLIYTFMVLKSLVQYVTWVNSLSGVTTINKSDLILTDHLTNKHITAGYRYTLVCLHRLYKFASIHKHSYSICSTPSNNQVSRQVRWSCILGWCEVELSIPSNYKQSLQATSKTFDISSVSYLLAQRLQVRLVKTQVWGTQLLYSCNHTSTWTVFIFIYTSHKYSGTILSLHLQTFLASTEKTLPFTNTVLRDLNKDQVISYLLHTVYFLTIRQVCRFLCVNSRLIIALQTHWFDSYGCSYRILECSMKALSGQYSMPLRTLTGVSSMIQWRIRTQYYTVPTFWSILLTTKLKSIIRYWLQSKYINTYTVFVRK